MCRESWFRVVAASAVTAALLFGAAAALAQPALTPWPMLGQNNQRTGMSLLSDGPQAGFAPAIDWMSSGLSKSLAIGADHVIYSGASALNSDGSLRWRLGLPSQTPAIALDGTIYFAGSRTVTALQPPQSPVLDQDMYLLNATTIGQFTTTSDIPNVFFSPAIHIDGNVVVTDNGGLVYKLTPDLRLLWKFQAGGPIETGAAIGTDGTIYIGSSGGIGSNGGYLYVLDSNGGLRWKYHVSDDADAPPVIDESGKTPIVYFTTEDYNLWSVDPVAKVKRWNVRLSVKSLPGKVWGCPCPAFDSNTKTIYCGGRDGLYALGTDGKLKWRLPTGYMWAQPVIDKDGTVYALSYADGKLYAVSKTGVVLWSVPAGTAPGPGAVLDDDGTLYLEGRAIRNGGLGRPSISWLGIRPKPPVAGADITLYPISLAAGNAAVACVDFYEDDGDGVPDEDLDTHLGTTYGPSTWSLPIGGRPSGTYRFFAVATDADGHQSNVVTNEIAIP